MGLFSFNYDKEGPGVEKDAPKKHGFIRFFELYFKNFWKLCINSIWYWLFSVTVIFSGFGAAGMTNITRNMAIDTHSFGTSDFFLTIKKNWKQALPVGIINALIIGFLCWDIYVFYTSGLGTMRLVGISVAATVLLMFCVMRHYIWLLLIMFKFKIKQIYVNAFKLVFAGMKNNLCTLLALALIYGISFGLAYTGINLTSFLFYTLLFFVVPGYRFFAIQFNVFPVVKKYLIDPYYTEHPDEDIELRRSLGVLD